MWPRALAALGALFCAAATALSAYAAHGADALVRGRLESAALFLFLHGLALLVLAPRGLRWTALGLAAGTLLFSGSLVGAALLGLPTTLAPAGGMLLIASWLLAAIALLRR